MTESSSPESTTYSKLSRSELALLLVLVAIHFTHMVDFVIIMPLGKRFMNELNLKPDQFGQIVAIYAIAAGIASLLASAAMDRFDRKSVLLTMYAGFGCSTLYCGLASSYETLMLARALAGVFGGLATVAIMAVIGDIFPAEKRGRATGAISSSFAVASIAGLPLGLWLTQWYGRGSAFIVLGAISGIVWIVGFFRLPPVRGHLDHPRTGSVAELIRVARNPNHLRAYVFTFFLVLGTFTIAAFVAPYLCTTNDWTEADLAPMYLAAGISTLIGMNAIGRMADTMPRLMLFRIFGTAAIVMGLVLTNLPPGPLWVASIAMSLFMVFAAGRFIPAQAIILGVAESRHRGAFMSLNTAVQHLATGVAPLIAGCLIAETEDGKLTGFPQVGLVASGMAVVALVLGGLLRPAPTSKPAENAEDEPAPAEPAAAAPQVTEAALTARIG